MNSPSFREFTRYWLRLGFRNFAGPDGRVERLRRDLVEARGWVAADAFARGRDLCRLLPGAESHQLAVYLGWLLFGWRGGAAAGLLVLLAPVLWLLALAGIVAALGHSPLPVGALRGVAGAAAAVAAAALWRMARRRLRHPLLYGFALASFIMAFLLHLKFRGIVVAAGLMGLWLGSVRPEIFCPGGPAPADPLDRPRISGWGRMGRVAAIFAGIWLLVDLPVLFGASGPVLPRLLGFATQTGFLAFGGACPVLSHVEDTALRLGWAGRPEVLLGLGLAGTAPGPLLLAAQCVGFFAAWSQPGALDPLLAGVLGGLLTAFGLFLPGCALVFAAAPFARSLAANTWLRSALTGINAALAGVLLKLVLDFAGTAFLPAGGGVDYPALAAACLTGLALWRGRGSLPLIVPAAALLGAAWALLG